MTIQFRQMSGQPPKADFQPEGRVWGRKIGFIREKYTVNMKSHAGCGTQWFAGYWKWHRAKEHPAMAVTVVPSNSSAIISSCMSGL